MSFEHIKIYIISFFGYFLIYIFFPLLWLQGAYLKRVVLRLPTPNDNKFGEIKGGNYNIEILGLGESTVAGVGISKNSETLTGLTSLQLNKLMGCYVKWEILAENGLTIKNLNDLILKESPNVKDLVIVSIGGNDVFNLTPPWIWLKQLDICIKYFLKKKESPIILFSAVPCVGRFPAIPYPLRFFFGYWELLLQKSLKLFVSTKDNVYLLRKRFPDGKEYFLKDGIHPSRIAYNLWSNELAFLSCHLISIRKHL